MPAPEGYCWLCKKFGKLTKEHIPPEKAFNNRLVLLSKVDEQATKHGTLSWSPHREQRGVYFRSLCEECNNRYGQRYGGAYVDFVHKVAERIPATQDFHQMDICGVKRPLAVLKQLMLQFVTANGEGFVQANDWVAPFIRNQTNRTIPTGIGIYLYAANRPGAKVTGIGAQIDLNSGRGDVLAEFTFWPLGTVLSFGTLANERLTPIHEWIRYPYDFKGTVDIRLSVNPTATPNLLDFRSEYQVHVDQTKVHEGYEKPSEDWARALFGKAAQHRGRDNDNDSIVISHPSNFRKD